MSNKIPTENTRERVRYILHYLTHIHSYVNYSHSKSAYKRTAESSDTERIPIPKTLTTGNKLETFSGVSSCVRVTNGYLFLFQNYGCVTRFVLSDTENTV